VEASPAGERSLKRSVRGYHHLGNLMDRAFRPPGPWRGEVIDWIELPNWPVFNIADSAIVMSAILMSLLAIRNIEPYKKVI